MFPSKDRKQLYFSGGFGYVGLDQKPDVSSPQAQAIFTEVEKVAKRFFPKEYQQAVDTKSIDRRLCLRPMTPDGISIIDNVDGAIFIGGTNAGGTVQAPLLAKIAADLVEGRSDVLSGTMSVSRFVETGRTQQR